MAPLSFGKHLTDVTFWELQEPLHTYMLPHLISRMLASLRCTCKRFQHLIDSCPVEALLPAMQPHLPHKLTGCATNSLTVQAMLRSQAALTHAICSSYWSARLVHVPLKPSETIWRPLWGPEWPYKSLLAYRQDEAKTLEAGEDCIVLK